MASPSNAIPSHAAKWTVVNKDGTVSTFERFSDARDALQREYPYTWREKIEQAVMQGHVW